MSNRLLVLALGLGMLAVTGCDLDVPDLNNPGIDQLQVDPTPPSVNAASTGMLVGNRANKSTTVGLVNQLGILGRESYDFDANDSRFVTELIQGNLQRGSPFGGVFWAANYTIIRLGYLTVDALDKIDPSIMADSDKASMRGFVHTMIAVELLTVILTHGETGAPIDVDRTPGSPDLAPFVPRDKVYAEIVRLLDLGQTELMASLPAKKPEDAAFTFPLSPGFAGFDTPLTFIQFNRAMRARVGAYIASRTPDAGKPAAYQMVLDALGQSFLVDGPTPDKIDFTLGVYYSFSLNAGDATNGLTSRPIFAHPGLLKDVTMKPDPMDATKMVVADQRYLDKVRDRTSSDPPGSTSIDSSLTTTVKFKMYTNITPIGLIRNEDLILLKAEALWFTGQHDQAVTELNLVRVNSGKLTGLAVPTTLTTNDQFVDALLYERRYSLLFEGGHRWIDLLRFGRSILVDDAPPTAPIVHTANVRYPVPQAECDARPGEPACQITSSSPAP